MGFHFQSMGSIYYDIWDILHIKSEYRMSRMKLFTNLMQIDRKLQDLRIGQIWYITLCEATMHIIESKAYSLNEHESSRLYSS